MRLYDLRCDRLYVNATERKRFLACAKNSRSDIASFCMTLAFTGCRISEALELRASSLQLDQQILTLRTLKRRDPTTFREVPIPTVLANALKTQVVNAIDRPDPLMWSIDGRSVDRTTAYRWIKATMLAADISGAKACPKGLRHGFGIHAMRCGVQLNMLQKWMGHASMSTTSIYANALGADELAIAQRMW